MKTRVLAVLLILLAAPSLMAFTTGSFGGGCNGAGGDESAGFWDGNSGSDFGGCFDNDSGLDYWNDHWSGDDSGRMFDGGNDNPDPVPEPATMLLFGLGLAGAGVAGKLRRKA